MNEIDIPRYVDAQHQFFFWELDEVVIIVSIIGMFPTPVGMNRNAWDCRETIARAMCPMPVGMNRRVHLHVSLRENVPHAHADEPIAPDLAPMSTNSFFRSLTLSVISETSTPMVPSFLVSLSACRSSQYLLFRY